ncbi:MAG: hypothetical protein HN782_00825 [Candidatus Marinimicrobia bacterium]|nr:hypothetical protein [Candidatus Neomarinimicrobiota bacterium]
MKRILYFIIIFSIFIGCEEVEKPDRSTWNIIQEEVLLSSCANCHASQTAITKQSGLDLSKNEAYSEMVGVSPKNIAAKEDGLVIVSNEGGMKGLAKSFLWEKINAYDREHYLSDHPQYGQMMPPGENFLSDGQLKFIRSWIEAGAPESGIVVDEKLLLDSNRYSPPEFTPLNPPEKGIQLHIKPFEVKPNYEREFFQYTDLNIDGDIYANRIEIEMRSGSHHFILYSFDKNINNSNIPEYDIKRELRFEDGTMNVQTLRTMQYHEFFSGTQWPRMDYNLPPGVAFKLNSKFGIDQNAHYVNRSDSIIIGEVFTNIHTIDRSEVEKVANIINWSNQEILLPPRKVTTLNKSFITDAPIYIGQLFSHAHEKMTEFVVKIKGGERNGELVYWTDDWEHPPIINYDPPIQLNNGEGLELIATYDNQEDRFITFGFLSTDEMMILFGWYYK